MVEDDPFTYQARRQPAEPIAAAQTDTLDYSLISKERTQKLDLLIHLLANLPHSLIVCGPEGIGKTTLLTVLQEHRTGMWQYCLLQGNADLSFEVIQRQLAQTISREQALARTFAHYQEQHKQVILIIDNAGELVPGLITAVIQYAIANPALKVIFALTHDELQVKRGSDRAVDDCHIIEIPTLSEKQCGDFLQHLSINPSSNLAFKTISDSMIAHIYRETHGVPGRIIAEVSGLPKAKPSPGKLTWILLLALTATLAIAFRTQWPLLSKDNKQAVIAQTVIEQEQNLEAIETETALPIEELPPVEPVVELLIGAQEQVLLEDMETRPEANIAKDDAPALAAEEKTQLKNDGAIAPIVVNQPVKKPEQPAIIKQPTPTTKQPASSKQPESKIKTPTKPEPAAEIAAKPNTTTQAKTAEQLWAAQEKLKQAKQEKPVNPEPLAAPPTNHFTLQLVVLSKQASVKSVIKKYPAMEPDIKIIKTQVNGQNRFVLYYGVYPDEASANRAKQSLPFEFRNALVKKE